MKWTKSPDQIFTDDNRGWQKGKRRKWNKNTEKKIKNIYQSLKNNEKSFYFGATAIELEWKKRYKDDPPPLRTIGRIMKDLNLSSSRKKNRHKGASKYLCYPEFTIYNLLGGRVSESDFIGEKFITGRTEPINFISFCFKKSLDYAILSELKPKRQIVSYLNARNSLKNLKSLTILK